MLLFFAYYIVGPRKVCDFRCSLGLFIIVCCERCVVEYCLPGTHCVMNVKLIHDPTWKQTQIYNFTSLHKTDNIPQNHRDTSSRNISHAQVWTQPQTFQMFHWHETGYFVNLTNLICVVWAGHEEKEPSEWIICGIRNLCRPGPCRCVEKSIRLCGNGNI